MWIRRYFPQITPDPEIFSPNNSGSGAFAIITKHVLSLLNNAQFHFFKLFGLKEETTWYIHVICLGEKTFFRLVWSHYNANISGSGDIWRKKLRIRRYLWKKLRIRRYLPQLSPDPEICRFNGFIKKERKSPYLNKLHEFIKWFLFQTKQLEEMKLSII